MATDTVRRTTVDFADFSFGEFGSLGSWNAPKGSFTGQNVVRYVDGSIGPRNGIKALTVTGLPASALGSRIGITPQGDLWFQVGTLVKTIDATSTAAQASTAIGDAVVDLNQGQVIGETYVYAVTTAAGIKRLDFTAPAVTNVAASPNGTLLIQYGDRTLVAGGSARQRLYYSAAGDPESWPASNFIDVGTGTAIKALIPLRGGVAIYTEGSSFNVGNDGRWWILSGVPGVNDTLREVLRGSQGPLSDADVAVPGNGVPTFAATHSEVVGFFDGSIVKLLRHLSLGQLSVIDARAVVALRDESDVLVFAYAGATASSGVGLMRRDGAWLKQAFAEADVKYVLTTRDGTLPSGSAPISRAQNLVIFATGASPPVFYIWSAYNDRPPFSGDYSATILDPSVVYFELPEWWAKDGQDVAVRKVIVSFKDWDTDDSNANKFDVVVTPLRQYAEGATAGGEGSTLTQSWTRATSASTAAGVNLRFDAGFTESWGNGFKVKIANMRGVAIQKIQVVLHERPVQGI